MIATASEQQPSHRKPNCLKLLAANINRMIGKRARLSRTSSKRFVFIFLIIFEIIHNNSVLSVPQQTSSNSNQRTSPASDYDKQLLRKALESSSSSSDSSPSSANFQCPEQFGYYTDTRDCTKYYVCVFGEVLHESCTGGLRFSRELQTCDWPRNVDCPQLNGSSTTSSSTTMPSTTTTATTLSPTTVTTSQTMISSSSSSTYSVNNKQHSSHSNDAKDQSSDASSDEGQRSPPHKSSSSLVFADEGSDPQQPSFDEAVSPVITSDGTIHLHDGSGGTFSLTPNHNRQQQPQQSTDNERQPVGGNVDVFVKPLSLANARPRNQQQPQPQLIASSAGSQQNRPSSSSPKLQPATLPMRQASQQQKPQQQGNLRSVNSNSRNNNNQFGDSPDNESETSSGGDDNDSQSLPPTTIDSISAQADQESNENQEDSLSDQPPRQASRQSSSAAGAYIPPVMAPNTLRQLGSQAMASSTPSGRQTSQLLSINNRQVDPTRQSFKPILVNPSVPSHHHNENNQFNGANNNNQSPATGQRRDQMQQFQPLPPQRPPAEPQQPPSPQLNNNNMQDDNNSAGELDAGLGDESAPSQPLRPAARPQQFRNQTIQPQPLSRQQQLANFAAMQNNRQSRMSNFQQFNQPPPPQQQQPNNRQFLTDNVNFNDSSKLIRLQASQFQAPQQQDQLLLPPADSATPAGGQQFQPNSNKFASLQPSRSQSVLFSQQPFGFAATDSSASGQTNFRSAEVRLLEPQPGNGQQFQAPQQPASQSSMLQQQRRPRPPKRQQIPSGPPSSGRAGNGRSAAGSRPPSQPLLGESLDTSTQPTMNSFLSPHDASFMEAPPLDNSNQLGPTTSAINQVTGSTTTTRTRLGNVAERAGRPIVAPTTVNFQQHDLQPMFQPTATTNLPSSSSQAATNGRQRSSFNDESLRPQGNARLHANGQGHHNNQRAQLIAADMLPPTFSNVVTTNAPTTPLVALTTPGNNLATTTTTQPTTTNQQQPPNDQQDPQLVANRYLNSAIDALEAGQPFGTNDYDFDILNDNSTDRRSPTTSFQSTNNRTVSSFNVNVNGGGRQRQFQANQQDDGGENISLTNGQPSGGQLGLNLRPTNQQQQQQQPRDKAKQASVRQPQQPQFNANGNSMSGNQPASQQQQQPTKKPRPANKKIVVNHEQALANIRASTEPAKRPEPLFATPTALQTAAKCDNRVCRLPDCKCGDTLNPGGLDPKVIPQVVLLTFDDAVNDLNWEIYEELFTGRTNPNGCPVLATFYVSHEWTDYGQVQTLYSRGHEMASHSITHSFGEKFSKNQWFKEVNGQREILNMYGGVKMNDVRGMRAPFLQIGGNKMFEMLYDANFTYDSSMPIFENSPPMWPYTLDYQLTHECMITPCPTKSFPGVWEVGMTMWVDLRGGRCSMGDACSNPQDEDGVYEMLMKNFDRHYKSNRAPFGLFYHSAWFNTVHHRRGFLKFMGTVNALSDVFFVTNWQMLQWMRQPTPLSEIDSFEPWQCPAKNDRPPPCFHPSVCNVKSEHGKYLEREKSLDTEIRGGGNTINKLIIGPLCLISVCVRVSLALDGQIQTINFLPPPPDRKSLPTPLAGHWRPI